MTGQAGCPGVVSIVVVALIEPHLNAVGGAAAVDHRHAGKARPVGLEEQSAAWLRRRRSAVDEDGERRDRAGDFQRQRIGLRPACRQFEPRAVRRKQDVQPALGVRDATFAR